MRIETELASHVAKEMRRIPELNYHKLMVSVSSIHKVAPFDWEYYFEQMGANGIDSLNVSD